MSGSGLYSDYGLDDNEDEHGFWSVSDDEVEATERDAGGADISEAVYDAKNMHPANRRNGIPSHLKTESGAMILPDGKIASEKPIPELFRDIEASQIDRTFGTFAAVLRNGRVVTGGDARNGGVIPDDVQGELMNQKVQKISSTYFAYAALLGNSRVVTWGNARWGGNSSAVQDELKDQVVEIYSTGGAFAAVLRNGRVVTWGKAIWGGDSRAVQEELSRAVQEELSRAVQGELKDQVVKQISSTGGAFAAVLGDGRVVTWGDAGWGGDSSAVQGELKGQAVKQIYSTRGAFATVLENGRVVTWGSAHLGGDAPGELKDQVVKQIYSNGYAFAAVLDNGRVVTWGRDLWGGDSSGAQGELRDQVVEKIYSTAKAFAAVLGNGRVVTWGGANYDGDMHRNVQAVIEIPSGFRVLDVIGNSIILDNHQVIPIDKSDRSLNDDKNHQRYLRMKKLYHKSVNSILSKIVKSNDNNTDTSTVLEDTYMKDHITSFLGLFRSIPDPKKKKKESV